MNNIKKSFEKHCGEKFDKFMEKLLANEKGDIELFFWQEKLINSFLASHPEYKIDTNFLLEIIRNGSEISYECPAQNCWGTVVCTDYKIDLWGCGECGEVWTSKKQLLENS